MKKREKLMLEFARNGYIWIYLDNRLIYYIVIPDGKLYYWSGNRSILVEV